MTSMRWWQSPRLGTVWYHGLNGGFTGLGTFFTKALLQKHYVSKRSRRQRGVLTMLARDAEARVFCYADATIRKEPN